MSRAPRKTGKHGDEEGKEVDLHDEAALAKPIDKMLVNELKKELEIRGLNVSGKKAELADRLKEYFEEQKAGSSDVPEPQVEKMDVDGEKKEEEKKETEIVKPRKEEEKAAKTEKKEEPKSAEQPAEKEKEKEKEKEGHKLAIPRSFAVAVKETILSPSAPKKEETKEKEPEKEKEKEKEKAPISLSSLKSSRIHEDAKIDEIVADGDEIEPMISDSVESKPIVSPAKRPRENDISVAPSEAVAVPATKRPRLSFDEGEYITSEDPVPESAIEATNIVLVTNLSRPLSPVKFKTLLETFGDVRGLMFNTLKSRCLVTFETVEGATKARQTLWHASWESCRNIELQFVSASDASSPDTLLEGTAAAKPVPKAVAPEKKVEAPTVEKKEDEAAEAAEEEPEKPKFYTGNSAGDNPLLNYFKKTEAKPCIYYLPLTEDEVVAKRAEEAAKRRNEIESRNGNNNNRSNTTLKSYL